MFSRRKEDELKRTGFRAKDKTFLTEGPDGAVELAFVTKNLRTGKVCLWRACIRNAYGRPQLALSNGIAFVKKTDKAKL